MTKSEVNMEELIKKNLMEINKKRNPQPRRKKNCVSGMVLGIIGSIFSFILPVVTFGCSIPGLVVSVNSKKKNYNATAGIVLNIVAIVIAGINSIIGVILTIRYLSNENKD